MKFNYTIRGRVAGCPKGDQLYEGVLEASTPKEAILNALAVEFGDPADGTPYEQITSGWSDFREFDAQYNYLNDDDQNFEFYNDDSVFDIEVTEVN